MHKKLTIGILTIVLIFGLVHIALAQSVPKTKEGCPYQMDGQPKQACVKKQNDYRLHPYGKGKQKQHKNKQHQQQRQDNSDINGSPNECPYAHNPQRTR
ncbi:MAG TPA: hypothetical protein VF095_11660 [Bacillota bacterium]